jgi:hypothetical protein
MQRATLAPPPVGAYGQPAGYYAGRAEPFVGSSTPEFARWLTKNQATIDDIQRRIGEIRAGTRRPACIGEDRYTCIATLAQKMAVADVYFLNEASVFAETKYDVNGKPIPPTKIVFDGYLPNAVRGPVTLHPDHMKFVLKLDSQGNVVSLEAGLPENLTAARTQEEYDATLAYEVISAVTANACPTLGRTEVARWIENTIKPTAQLTAPVRSKETRVTAQDLVTKKTAFCGRTFRLHTIKETVRHVAKRETSLITVIEIE